ncbi:DUF6318 family protein [Micrococcus sp. IITD107]|uniref:DUF6318 family protein n=1 Tax=Micrococcus sp. IITD107 TaxID=3342790 RepID=UPI0035BA96C7
MRRPNRLTMPLALSAAAALLLTGCTGGGDGGDESPSPTAGQSTSTPVSESPGGGSESATPTESATPEPATSTSAAKNIPAPEMPDAMKKNDQAGLEAALEYWYEAFHYLKLTGDAEPLMAVSAEDCGFCHELIGDWTTVYDVGGWAVVEQNGITIDVAALNGETRGTYLYRDQQAPVHVYQPDGTKAERASTDNDDVVYWSASASFDEGDSHWKIESLSTEGKTEE